MPVDTEAMEQDQISHGKSNATSGGFGPELLSADEEEEVHENVVLSTDADIIRHVAQDLDERSQTLLSLTCKQWFEGRPDKADYSRPQSPEINYRAMFDDGESPWEVPLDNVEVGDGADVDRYDYDLDVDNNFDNNNDYVTYGNDDGYDNEIEVQPMPVPSAYQATSDSKKRKAVEQIAPAATGKPPHKKKSKYSESSAPSALEYPRTYVCERCSSDRAPMLLCATCPACWHSDCVFPPLVAKRPPERFRCRGCISSSPPNVLAVKWQWDPMTSSHEKLWFLQPHGASYRHVRWVPDVQLSSVERNVVVNASARHLLEQPPAETGDAVRFLRGRARSSRAARVEACGRVPAAWATIERIVDSVDNANWQQGDPQEDRFLYLVKWEELQYADCTWEVPSSLGEEWKQQVQAYRRRRDLPSLRRAQLDAASRRKSGHFPPLQSSNLPLEMPRFALEGANRLRSAWYDTDPHRRCVLMAYAPLNAFSPQSSTSHFLVPRDDPPLMKHLQLLAFLKSIFDDGSCRGPIAILSSHADELLSRLKEWLPDVDSVLLTQESAHIFRFYEMEVVGTTICRFQIVVTRPPQPLLDAVDWALVVFEQSLSLKKSRLPPAISRMKIAITDSGLKWERESASLKWLLPHLMKSKTQFDLEPFAVRRTINDIFYTGQLQKRERLVGINLTDFQKHVLRSLLTKIREQLCSSANDRWEFGELFKKVWKEFRNGMNHPFLDTNAEAECNIPPPELNRIVQSSGKLQVLEQLLPALQRAGRRALIIAQHPQLVDILDDFLSLRQLPFGRIDENTLPSDADRVRIVSFFNSPSSQQVAFIASENQRIQYLRVDTIIFFDCDREPLREGIEALSKILIPDHQTLLFLRLVTRNSPEECFVRYRVTIPSAPSEVAHWAQRADLNVTLSECHHILSRGAKEAFAKAMLKPKPEPGTIGLEPNLLKDTEIASILNVAGEKDTKMERFGLAFAPEFAVSDQDYVSSFDSSDSAVQKFWSDIFPGLRVPDQFARRAHQLASHLIRQSGPEQQVALGPTSTRSASPVPQPSSSAGPSASNGSLPPVKATQTNPRPKNLSAKSSSSRPTVPRSSYQIETSSQKSQQPRLSANRHVDSVSDFAATAATALASTTESGHPPEPQIQIPSEFVQPLPRADLLSAMASLSKEDIHSLAFNGTTSNRGLNALGIFTAVEFFRHIIVTRSQKPTLFEDQYNDELATIALQKSFPMHSETDKQAIENLLTRYGLDIPSTSFGDQNAPWSCITQNMGGTVFSGRKDGEVKNYANVVISNALAGAKSGSNNLLFEKIGILSLIRAKINQDPFDILDAELHEEWTYLKSAWSREKDKNLLVGAVTHGRYMIEKILSDAFFERREVELFMVRMGMSPSVAKDSGEKLFEDYQVTKFLRERFAKLEKAIVAEALYLKQLKEAGMPDDAYERSEEEPIEIQAHLDDPPADELELAAVSPPRSPLAVIPEEQNADGAEHSSSLRLSNSPLKATEESAPVAPSATLADVSFAVTLAESSAGTRETQEQVSSRDQEQEKESNRTEEIQAPVPTRAGVVAPLALSPMSPSLPTFVIRVPSAPDPESFSFNSSSSL
jgi:hypothetical protein